MTSDFFLRDIPPALAEQAHAGTSFSPERRGDHERQGYADTLATDYRELARHATNDAKLEQLAHEFARYREGYRRRFVAYLGAKSACVSTMIAGGSNFNVRRAQKRSASADKRTIDLIEFRERALKAIKKTLTPELQPIQLGDADAGDRLQAKIEKLESFQVRMKTVNAAIRTHAKTGHAAQVTALVALGCSEQRAHELLTPDFCGRVGFADFELKNNNANIRRLKGRVAVVETTHAQPATVTQGESTRLEDVPAENRVKLFFTDKPATSTRTDLKAHGFRWSPTQGCWLAYRNDRAMALAQRLVSGQ